MEAALAGATSSVATLADAVAAVAEDVRPGDAEDAAFLSGAAEGLLFEALVATLKPVRAHACWHLAAGHGPVAVNSCPLVLS